MEILFGAVIIGLLPAAIGHSKGGSFFKWWVFGALLFIVALPMALIMKKDEAVIAKREGMRKCPHCAEYIKADAHVCRFCRAKVEPEPLAEVSDYSGKQIVDCLYCGQKNTGERTLCVGCGHPLS